MQNTQNKIQSSPGSNPVLCWIANSTAVLIVCALVLLPSQPVEARPPDDAEIKAAPLLASEIARWVRKLSNAPKSVSIFNIFANSPLDQDFSSMVEAELVKALKDEEIADVSSCSECRSPQIVLQGEKLVIRKGTPDAETLEKIGERHPVEAFLIVDINRTSFYLIGQATLYQNPSGAVMAAERFEIPALKLDDSSVQILVTAGIGNAIGGTQTGAPFSTAIGLGIYEELGFGKGGLTLGTVLGGSAGTLIYVNPSMSFRGRFGVSAVTWSFNLGAGLGLISGTRGIAMRGAYDVYLGSWALVGVEGIYYIPEAGSVPGMNGFVGLHLGFSIGR
jgi:hypothetical protein